MAKSKKVSKPTSKTVEKVAETLATAATPAPAAPAVVAVEVAAEPSNFLMFVGDHFYTKEDFIAEASAQGVSKRLPSFRVPADLKCGASKVWLAAGGGRKGEAAEVFGYFIPDAVEFIAGEEGEKTYADVIAHIKTISGSKIVTSIAGEKLRKCGVRKIGGTYLAASVKTDSPLVLTPAQEYKGNFFRGMMRLDAEKAKALENGLGIENMVSETCMVCFADMLTSNDSATRAARERRRMEKGEAPKWLLKCPHCLAKERADKKAGKAPAALPPATAAEAAIAKAIENPETATVPLD